MTDTGTNQGEILSEFMYLVSSNSFRLYSSDNNYKLYSNASDITYSDTVTSTLTSLTGTDKFSSSTSTFSCPIRSTIKSFTSEDKLNKTIFIKFDFDNSNNIPKNIYSLYYI
jgi:hypothetical protein